jgi:hypothetical protein
MKAKWNISYRSLGVLLIGGGIAVAVTLAHSERASLAQANESERSDDSASKIQIGFAISPVELDLGHKNRSLVGLGSYLVNAQAGCADCHTQPQYLPGGSPFLGQPEQINTNGFLAGGRAFGPFISRNLTPDANGLPAGLTYEQFDAVMRTGIDLAAIPPHVPTADNDLLQVMPWPVYRNLTERDMQAIYEYLSAIPSVN